MRWAKTKCDIAPEEKTRTACWKEAGMSTADKAVLHSKKACCCFKKAATADGTAAAEGSKIQERTKNGGQMSVLYEFEIKLFLKKCFLILLF